MNKKIPPVFFLMFLLRCTQINQQPTTYYSLTPTIQIPSPSPTKTVIPSPTITPSPTMTATPTPYGGGGGRIILCDSTDLDLRKSFPDAKGENNIFLANWDGGELYPLLLNAKGLGEVLAMDLGPVSPDGNKALLRIWAPSMYDPKMKEDKLFLISLHEGDPNPVLMATPLWGDVLWVDSQKIVYIGGLANNNSGIYLLDINDDNPKLIYSFSDKRIHLLLAANESGVFWQEFTTITYLDWNGQSKIVEIPGFIPDQYGINHWDLWRMSHDANWFAWPENDNEKKEYNTAGEYYRLASFKKDTPYYLEEFLFDKSKWLNSDGFYYTYKFIFSDDSNKLLLLPSAGKALNNISGYLIDLIRLSKNPQYHDAIKKISIPFSNVPPKFSSYELFYALSPDNSLLIINVDFAIKGVAGQMRTNIWNLSTNELSGFKSEGFREIAWIP
jgi:hypothetical protein